MKKPDTLGDLAYALHSAHRGGTPTSVKLDLLTKMESHVLHYHWHRAGVFLAVVKSALIGKTQEEIAEQLYMDLDQVERMLFRINQQLQGRFAVALAHYFAGEYEVAFQVMGELGYSDARFFPAEMYQHFRPKRGSFDLEDCETEMRFLASLSLARVRNETEPRREKVEHLLAVLHATDAKGWVERAQLITILDNLATDLRISPYPCGTSNATIQFADAK